MSDALVPFPLACWQDFVFGDSEDQRLKALKELVVLWNFSDSSQAETYCFSQEQLEPHCKKLVRSRYVPIIHNIKTPALHEAARELLPLVEKKGSKMCRNARCYDSGKTCTHLVFCLASIHISYVSIKNRLVFCRSERLAATVFLGMECPDVIRCVCFGDCPCVCSSRNLQQTLQVKMNVPNMTSLT